MLQLQSTRTTAGSASRGTGAARLPIILGITLCGCSAIRWRVLVCVIELGKTRGRGGALSMLSETTWAGESTAGSVKTAATGLWSLESASATMKYPEHSGCMLCGMLECHSTRSHHAGRRCGLYTIDASRST